MSWKLVIEEEWKRRRSEDNQTAFFPLIAQSFDQREITAVVDALLSGRLTMAEKVREFEKQFSTYMKVPYAVMVNSGSSANLLALAVASNPLRKKHFKPGDEVLVPAVCWSTSVWPIVQMGLKPVFVDVNPETLNMNLKEFKKLIGPLTRGVVAVHILGNSVDMVEFRKIIKEYELIVIEDTCESLGSKTGTNFLGTNTDFGTFSFYYSHHITTGEGGMVTCQTLEDYDLLKCLRAHGWSRELSNRKELETANSQVDPRFLFVNVGYNLRPMEVQAAFGICQLERLHSMNTYRNSNREKLISSLQKHPRWREQFRFPVASPQTEPAWFGFAALLSQKLSGKRKEYLEYLSSQGVENRPIVSGNFVRQPALKLLGIKAVPEDFPGAETIDQSGFFIGLHTEELGPAVISKLSDILLNYEF